MNADLKIILIAIGALLIGLTFTPLPEMLGRALKSKPMPAVIHVDGLDRIPVAVSSDALADFTVLASHGDNAGKIQLEAEGKIFHVDDATPITVLSNGPVSSEVRIRAGEYEGKTAYVYSEWVSR